MDPGRSQKKYHVYSESEKSVCENATFYYIRKWLNKNTYQITLFRDGEME